MSPLADSPTTLASTPPKTFTTREIVKGEKEHVIPPSYVDDEIINLSENSLKVLERRYLRRDIDGTLLETSAGMFYRVANHIAAAEAAHGGDVEATTQIFYDLLTELRFFPNSPTFTGAGTPLGQLAACFVLPIADDMGRDSDGIFSTLRVAALIQQTGGGNGFSFSRLRPKGDVVHTSSGRATGPVGFLRVYDQAFGEIAQGGCLLPDTLVFTNAGLMRLDELVDVNKDGWQNHQLTLPTDDGQRSSPRGFNNGVAPVLRVETEQGLTISGTHNHKVKVMTSEGPVWRQLDSLQPGDSILVMLGQHQGKLHALRRPEKTHGNQTSIEFPSILDEPLAFVLGYLAGDGFVAEAESDHRIGFSVAHNSYLIEELPRLLQIVFPGCTLHTQQKSGDASVTFVIDSALVKRFLQMNGFVKGKSHDVSVPRLIRRSSVSIVGAYLRGLFEADGALSHNYPQLTTTSEGLAREVATLLIGLGCPVTIRANQYTERWGDRPQWIVRIQSHEGLAVWRERIGCDQRSRFVVCHTFQPNLEKETSYLLPHSDWWTGPVLDAITLPQIDRQQRGQGINFRSADPALRRKLLRYSRGDRQLTLSGYRELAAAHPEFAEYARPLNNLWFVTVSKIEDAGEMLTLDLEVDDNHTYLANGMVTHNTRRGANMGVLRVDHPDIEQFITCKAEEGTVTNFNISVAITDEFMRAVKNDTDFDLRSPRDGKVWKSVRARELFDKIIHYAHRNGEPGALFIDAANRSNPVPHLYDLEATNPCGEQWLGPYENCCLGSINLGVHVTEDADGEMIVDWPALERTVRESTHFLDNVVSANAYVPAIPEVAEAAFRARRIGLGIMGLGDLMYKLGIRYGSEEGQEFAGQVMEFVRYHCMDKSIELSEERGPFLAFQGSIYDPEKAGGMAWQPPTPIAPYSRDWGRPSVDWPGIVEGIQRHGIRNAAQTTVAPTGTIATVSGCEGYGCEPVFALGYIRHFKDGDKDVELAYTSPLFDEALERTDLPAAQKQRIKQHVATYGSCQDVEGLPEELRHAFVVSSDISADEHVRMQAAIQAFVDNSISKCVVGDTLLLTANGLVSMDDLSTMRLPDQFESEQRQIISPSGSEASDAFFYGGYKETRKVGLSYGFSIEGTPNHRVQILAADGTVQFAELGNLHAGDTVVLYGGQQQFGRAAQNLPGYSGQFLTNSKPVSFPVQMSTEFAFLLGCITAEGAITRNGVVITNTDVALLKQLQASYQSLFGLRSIIVADTRNSVHTLQVNSRHLRNWLLTELALESGAENKVIPNCILQASREEIAAFLRGLFLDGYMTQDGKLCGITLASERAIHQLQILLLNMGILATKRQTTERAWNLTVQGGELEALAQDISFVEVWKNERIAERNIGRIQRFRNYSRLLPASVTTALREMQTEAETSLRSLYVTEGEESVREYQRTRVNLLQGHRLERGDACRIYRHLAVESNSSYANNFFAHDDNSRIYVEVQSVEVGFAEVFDISVPGSHSFIANGIGNHNTCNFSEGATEADVANAYLLAWELGCKGLTVYVTGSRQEVVLETKATKEKKGEGEATVESSPNGYVSGTNGYHPGEAPAVFTKRPRPKLLQGSTYRKDTPLGTAYITVNNDEEGEPFEVFLNIGKAGSDVSAVSEAMGRLISLTLRMPASLPPSERLRWVMDEMAGIGGGRALGFGANRVRSLPDGVAQVIAEHLSTQPAHPEPVSGEQMALPLADRPIGDLCPDCGEAAFLNVEGCKKCYICGYSEC